MRDRAIPHEKNHRSRTYLIAAEDPDEDALPVVKAFVSLAIHVMDIEHVSARGMRKRLHGMYYPSAGPIRPVPCYLIGQLGKDDRHVDDITGDELISIAVDLIGGAQATVGGRFIKIDCEAIPGLVDLYERNGFRAVQNDVSSGLLEMVLFF